jgi:hypothetical protein
LGPTRPARKGEEGRALPCWQRLAGTGAADGVATDWRVKREQLSEKRASRRSSDRMVKDDRVGQWWWCLVDCCQVCLCLGPESVSRAVVALMRVSCSTVAREREREREQQSERPVASRSTRNRCNKKATRSESEESQLVALDLCG